MPQMPETQVKSILRSGIDTAVGGLGGQIPQIRSNAMDYYLSNPFGNEVEGNSQVISSDVADTIDSVLPDLVQPFTAGPEVVRYLPKREEEEADAKDATQTANYVWNRQNQGFNIFYDWFKDALLQINGIIKMWYDETPYSSTETYTELTEDELLKLIEPDNVEVLEHDEYEDPELGEAMAAEMMPDAGMMPPPVPMLHDVKIKITADPQIRIENVPPEEFLISPRAKNIPDAPFVAHQSVKTHSELIEMGYDRERVEALPEYNEQDYNEEKITRFNRDDEWPTDSLNNETSMKEVDWYEIYIRMDYDGDGVAELRQINCAGQGLEIFDNEEVDEHPFHSVTPIRMPHKFFGRSLAEMVMDIQLIKSEMLRQLLNNIYNLNNARTAANDRVDLDSLVTRRIGGVVQIEGQAPVGDALMEMHTTPIHDTIYPALEHFDKIREARSGVFRMESSLSSDSLHDTMGGVQMLLSAAQKRILMIARVFAEGGVKDAFSHLLTLLNRHQDKSLKLQLRGEWVEMKPGNWNPNMDVEIKVGLGHGTAEQRAIGSRMIMDIQEKIIGAMGAGNPLVGIGEVRNAFAELIQNTGHKDAEPFLKDPSDEDIQAFLQQKAQAAAQQGDPATAIAKMTVEVETQKAQLKDAFDREKMAMDNKRETEKMVMADQLEREKLKLNENTEAQKIRADAAKALTTAEGKSEELALKNEVEEVNADVARQELDIERRKLDQKDRELDLKAKEIDSKAKAEKAKTTAEKSSPGNITVNVEAKKGKTKFNYDDDGNVMSAEDEGDD